MTRRYFFRRAAALAGAPLIQLSQGSPAGRVPLRANGARVNGWLAQFDTIGRTPGGINRVAYSDADLAGRTFATALFRDAGLTPRIDAAGNIVGQLKGRDPALGPIVIGSHVDSVTDGGNFDGPLGSFGAIEVARTLRERNLLLRHPLEVVVWSNEEGGVIGSKLAVGDFRGRESRQRRTIRENTSAKASASSAGTSRRSNATRERPGAPPATSNCTSNRAGCSTRPG